MILRNTAIHWGVASQIMHWLVFILIIVQIILASIAAELPLGMSKLAFLSWHKSIGILILAICLLRLFWRCFNTNPAPPKKSKTYERILAALTHILLYFLLFSIPITGWLMSSARGFPVSVFGAVQLPDLVAKNKPLYELLQQSHSILIFVLAVVVSLHIGAALKHHFFCKNDVLLRMLPLHKTGQDNSATREP